MTTRKSISKITTKLLLAIVAICTVAPFAHAQKRDIIGSFRDWDALLIKEGNTKTCYMISTPKRSTANKKNVRRGDIYITVTNRPNVGVKTEVNAVMGYPLRPNSEVSFQIDGKRAQRLFTEGSTAWAYDGKDDAKLAAAMKAGSRLVVTGTSARGTRTTDTYSLSGFTAALNAINKACR
ncbi:invasion associated locus B family protein [Kordiimonas sp. SCSIO 12610]|uniref:invasion associated locus B family protein n=1 Tax=Kordiimonas sp. SCSIO 12610 TaxID=2829597 RepID=UPI00210AA9EA|nr:invasion associated locus B family protein [Kordiimonas sp. SCSIO 12610]UTW55618.1 invasion associated locus B family protein [Kordiimonas sp. SCSIO 12610]